MATARPARRRTMTFRIEPSTGYVFALDNGTRSLLGATNSCL
jgi:hypothetical protein